MAGVGLSDEIIIAKIRAHNKPTDLSTEDLVNLKKSRVSDNVIAALLNPNAPPSSTTTIEVSNPLYPARKPSGATSGIAGDPNDPMTPHDSGIYLYFRDRDGKAKMVELERTAYQGAKTGGIFTSAITYGIAKAKSKALIPGKAASIRIRDPQTAFYFYFDDKATGLSGNSVFASQNLSNPNQFALIRLTVDKNSRQTEIGEFSMWGASSGNNKKDTIPLRSERLKPGLYKVTVVDAPLREGEYCFMSAPVVTSSYAGAAGMAAGANLFDFGVDR